MYSFEEKICILFGEKGVPSRKFFQLLDLYGGVNEFVADFSANQVKEILANQHDELLKSIKRNESDKIVEEMTAENVVALTWFSQNYPRSLRDIDDCPYILFCKGNAELLKKDCISIVGTRKASSYGRRVASDFTSVLTEKFVIVSGLAYGIDSMAHETALKADGETIAVLGSGILNIYPTSNENLAQRIVNGGGLLISEYGLRALPISYHFPHRNRIVSGLSKGLLVCQAPQKSGTNSTVELALEQGKDVFVVPGEIYDFGFYGSNALIKSMQGACVTSPRDIIEFYGLDGVAAQTMSVQLSFDEQKICDALSYGQKTFDQLVAETKIALSDLNFLLANLELRSIIARLPGNLYRLYGGIK